MQNLLKKRSRKTGLPPGTLVHIGEKKIDKVKISLIDYDELHFEEKEIKTPEECFLYKDKPTTTWINLEGIHETEILEKLGNFYGIHPLALEDIVNTDQRPKMDAFENNVFIVFKMLSYNEKNKEIVIEQVSFILGLNFLISFQEGIKGDVFDPIRERLRTNKGKIRKSSTDYLAYSLLDAVIDNYFVILEKLGENIELLQEELIKNLKPEILHKIHDLKREMIFLRKSVWPLREVVSSFQREESNLIKDSTKIYLRDVYDHTIQVMDSIETFREMISAMIEIYLSNLNNRINSVMKVLTIIATIFMPPTFIVGIYGMNFKHMPELDWKYGYPAVMLIMFLIMLFMLYVFRKKKWI